MTSPTPINSGCGFANTVRRLSTIGATTRARGDPEPLRSPAKPAEPRDGEEAHDEADRADEGAGHPPVAMAARPQFLAYRVQDLTSPVPLLARNVLRMPLLTWTVRSPADRLVAARWADQMIFESFDPDG